MEVIRSRLGDNVDHAPEHAAELCLIVVGIDLEFFDLIDDRGDCVSTLEGPLVVNAVHQEEVAAIRLPVNGGEDEGASRKNVAESTRVLRNAHRRDARRKRE